MELDVSALKDGKAREIEVPIAITLMPVESGGDAIGFPVPFVGTVQALRTEDSIVVRLAVKGEVELQCSRCLTAFRQPLQVDFAEEFRGSHGDAVPGELEDDPETGATFVRYQGDKIQVAEVLRQHVLLEVPMKPLCSNTCQGLCPDCGHNRNEGPCRCAAAGGGDERFEVLRQLLNRPENDRL